MDLSIVIHRLMPFRKKTLIYNAIRSMWVSVSPIDRIIIFKYLTTFMDQKLHNIYFYSVLSLLLRIFYCLLSVLFSIRALAFFLFLLSIYMCPLYIFNLLPYIHKLLYLSFDFLFLCCSLNSFLVFMYLNSSLFLHCHFILCSYA